MKIDKKNTLLLVAIVFMLFASYHAAIKKTHNERRDYIANKEKKRSDERLPETLAQLQKREQELDQRLDGLNLGERSMHTNLLKFLNTQVGIHRAKLLDFDAPHISTDENGSHETYIFSLEGGYTDILKVLQALEHHGGFGAITHVAFEKRIEYRSKRKFLTAEVFLQQLR